MYDLLKQVHNINEEVSVEPMCYRNDSIEEDTDEEREVIIENKFSRFICDKVRDYTVCDFDELFQLISETGYDINENWNIGYLEELEIISIDEDDEIVNISII